MIIFLRACVIFTCVFSVDAFSADFIDVLPGSVPENSINSIAGELKGNVDGQETGLKWSIGVNDRPNWEIVSINSKMYLKMKAGSPSFNFESSDFVTVRISAINPELTELIQDVSIAIQDVNESPLNLIIDHNSCPEESLGATIGILSAQDPDAGDTQTYSVPVGSGYRIVSGNQLALAADRQFDFEDASVRGSYASRSVTVTVTDKGGLTATLAVTVVPTNVNEAPFNCKITNTSCAEESLGATIGALSAQDVDAGDTRTFSVPSSSGYRIVTGNQLALAADRKLDFEDASARGSYAPRTVTVTVQDALGLTATLLVTVVPLDVNEAPFNLALANSSCAEETEGAIIGTLSVQDVDAKDVLAYSVPVASGYRILGGQLALAAGAKLDREDATVRGSYVSRGVIVTATDRGGLTTTLPVSVDPLDVNEPPSGLQVATAAVPEDIELTVPAVARRVLTLEGVDADPTAAFHALTYAIAPGAAAAITDRFEVVGSDLRCRASQALDFESQRVWTVPIRISDGGTPSLSTAVDVTVTVQDADDPLRIAGWNGGSIAIGDLEQAVPAASGLSWFDQDAETPLVGGGGPAFARYNEFKLRFRLTGVSGDATAANADQAKHQLQFDLPPASGYSLVTAGEDTLVYRGTQALEAQRVATVSYDGGSRAALQVIVAGNRATGQPVISRADLTVVLSGISYRCYLTSGKGVPDLFLECSTEHPWEGFRREWTGWRRVQVSTANRRPGFTPVDAGAGVTAKRGSVGTLTERQFAIDDDYPTQGATLVIAYPPLHGRLELPDATELPLDGQGRAYLTVAPSAAGSSALPYVLTYRPDVTSAATSDSFIVQIRDGGVPPDGAGARTSELVPVPVVIQPGTAPSVSATMNDKSGTTVTFIEQGAPVPAVPSDAVVISQEDTLGAWTLYLGPPAVAPAVFGTAADDRFAVQGGATIRQTADGGIEWHAAEADPWTRIGAVSGTWTGIGRSLAIDLDPAINRLQAGALVRSLVFSRAGRRIPVTRTLGSVAIGFVATGASAPDSEQVSRQLALIGVAGVDDIPVWSPPALVLRTTSPDELVGVSEVRDADGDPLEGSDWTATCTAVTRLSAVSEVDPADGARIYRFTWSVRPDQAAGAGISFADHTSVSRQQITVQEVGSADVGLAFVSDAPFFQTIGERRFLPLLLTDGTARIGSGVDLFLTFPAGTTTTQRDAIIARLRPNPASGQLLVDFTGDSPPLAPGDILRCTLVANRSTGGAATTAQQPIMLKVLPSLAVAGAAQ